MQYYVCTDVHGFFNELIDALNNAGFDRGNPDHCLISLGDAMDRGPCPREVVEFFISLPNKILIKGNHCSLMNDAIERRYFASHDIHNGTADTAYDFSKNPNANLMNHAQILGEFRDDISWKKYKSLLVNYYETKNYIFCHGYIPCNSNSGKPWYQHGSIYTKRDDWRKATDQEWADAMWINGMKACASDGIYEEGKTIIVGHYHSSWGRATYEKRPEFGDGADFSPFYYQNKLIAMDGCTAYSGQVNVMMLEDDLLEE